MNEEGYRLLARERQQALLKEAKQARRLKEAGIRVHLPGEVGVVGLVLVGLPLAVWLARGWLKV